VAGELATGRGVKQGWRTELLQCRSPTPSADSDHLGQPRSRTARTSPGNRSTPHAARRDTFVYRHRPYGTDRVPGRLRGRRAELLRRLRCLMVGALKVRLFDNKSTYW